MSLWVGTYAEKGGKGLYPIEIARGRLSVGQPNLAITIASYGLWSQDTRTTYFTKEQEAGPVAAWRREDGRWIASSASDSGGALPCFLSLSPDRRHLAVANYGDGTVALLALDPRTGEIKGIADTAQQSGRGPDPARQAGPHAHCVVFSDDGSVLYHVDLGLDRVFAYEISDGKLGQAKTVFAAPPGSGARHLLLHSDRKHALLVSELSAELFLLERTATEFAIRQKLATAPEGTESDNLGGHLGLAVDGTILVTNRGHDSVSTFTIAHGRIIRGAWADAGGASPRHVHVMAGSLLVAHEESGTIALLSVPGTAGGEPVTAPVPGAAFVIDIPE